MRRLKWDASPSKLGHWAVVVVVAGALSKWDASPFKLGHWAVVVVVAGAPSKMGRFTV